MTVKHVKVYAPGSIANLGPGFDVFGIAIDGLGDSIELGIVTEPEVCISVSGVGADKIPTQPSKNSAGAILQHVIESYSLDHGFKIEIQKGIPPGTGMGSSGASAATAVVAVDSLLKLGLSRSEKVRLAALGEGAVAGSPHADNVSASLLGGFVIVGADFDVLRMEAPDMGIVVAVPDVYYENKTKMARELLPEKVGLREAVLNIMNASMMAAAVALKDPKLFGENINDYLVEPYRAKMIPHFHEVKKAALEAGAYGCSISGGGPSMFAVGDDPEAIGRAMVEAFGEVDSKAYCTRPSNFGARVI